MEYIYKYNVIEDICIYGPASGMYMYLYIYICIYIYM